MEKIKRPQRLEKIESNVMKIQNLQENFFSQLTNIYNKLDEIVEYINEKGG